MAPGDFMAQHFPRQPLPRPPEPFSETREPTVTSGLFWSRLLAYRPLFLLGGLWLGLVCVSAIAYHGLMFNQPVDNLTPREAPLAIAAPLPQAPAPALAMAPTDSSAPHPSTVTLWGIVSLLGLCAFGCFVLTQQIKASARPQRKPLRHRPTAKAKPQPPQPRRLTPYSPQRDGVVIPGARIVETLPEAQPAGPSAPRSAPPAPPQRRPAPQSQRLQQPPQSKPLPQPSQALTPAVIAAEADLPLDWSEGSVAHALDVRQRRSLSSFM